MEMMLLNILLLAIFSCCSGLPTYNAGSKQDAITSALDASIDQLNSQSWGRNLLKLSGTGVITIKPLFQDRDRRQSDLFEISLRFTIRETTCNKNTATDPSECEFQEGPYTATPCESKALVSKGKAIVLKAECNLSSSSESESSEEMFKRTLNSRKYKD
ncbi:secreted phosphoprotein 24 [Bufo bufo]|uniref:secreted phosphoprotein 24 n=1 Tax=Bufo bufo TaxID=8384 RepID=UPI001ABE18EE|nr:secreted phosphoprotein 24 [Bufo bufo]